MPDFNDAPISCPGDDRLGIDPLAKTISRCILNLQDPVGSVVAVHGRWGSGKSSLINLVRHHIAGTEAELTVLQFQCWLYRSEEALAIGFFRELYASLRPELSDSEKANEAFREIGARVAPAGPLLGAVTSALASPIAGGIVSSATKALGSLIDTNESDEVLQKKGDYKGALTARPAAIKPGKCGSDCIDVRRVYWAWALRHWVSLAGVTMPKDGWGGWR